MIHINVQTYDKTFYDMLVYIESIKKDCLYVLNFTVKHYQWSNGRHYTHTTKTRCFNYNGEFYEHINGYSHTRVIANYYNDQHELVRIDESFTVEKYEPEKDAALRRDLEKFKSDKSLHAVVYQNMRDPAWTYTMVMSKVAHYLDEVATLDDFAHFVQTRCGKNDKPDINQVSDIVIPSKIKVEFGKTNDNKSHSKTFDYIDVSVPIIMYAYTNDEMIEIIKTIKTDIDKLVLERIKKRLKHYGVTVNFLKLTNLTFTTDHRLLYKFSLKIS